MGYAARHAHGCHRRSLPSAAAEENLWTPRSSEGLAADNAEIDRLEAELKRAAGDAKTELKAKLDAARKKYEARRDLLLKRIDEIEREEKRRPICRIALPKSARHQARVAKLRQAWQLVQQAVAI